MPIQFRLLNRRITLLYGPDIILGLFKKSKEVAAEHWLVQVLVNAFGVEPSDAPFYLKDDTGISNQPAPRSNDVPAEHRIFYLVYKSIHVGLSGDRLDEMSRQLIRNVSTQLGQQSFTEEWTDVPDLYQPFIRKICFKAGIVSLCGSKILEVIPTFVEDFWTFDYHVPTLFKEVPSWLAPNAFSARDTMKQNVQKWHDYAHAHYDVDEGEDDPRHWEEYFGTRMMRTRHAFFKKMPLSKSTVAADDLGLIWA